MRGKPYFTATILAVLLGGTAAQAQVTCAQIWTDWKALMTSGGQALTVASEEVSDGAFTISGITSTITDVDVMVTTQMDELACTASNDGTATITMSDSYPITIASNPGAAEPFEVVLTTTQTNLRMVAGGSPGNTSYDFTADAVGLATTSVTEAGKPMPVSVVANLAGLSGGYTLTRGADEAFGLDSKLNAETLALSVDANDLEAQSHLILSAAVQQFAVSTNGNYGAFMDPENVAASLKAGLKTEFGYSYGPLTYSISVEDATGPTQIEGKSDGGGLDFALSAAGLAVTGGGKNAQMVLKTSQLPFPQVMVAYAESLIDFRSPVTAGPELQDFTAITRLIGVTVSEEIWALVDPMATLPRDPANLVIDLNGKAKLTLDIMDEAAITAAGEAAPGELHVLNVPALELSVGGAKFTGNGAFTFDNSDLVTFQGMPKPTGKLDLMLVGGNALLDKLIALGIVPEEQAMGARMMMGMFARPGTGPDTLTSTIEFKDGGLFANGMQLQ